MEVNQFALGHEDQDELRCSHAQQHMMVKSGPEQKTECSAFCWQGIPHAFDRSKEMMSPCVPQCRVTRRGYKLSNHKRHVSTEP